MALLLMFSDVAFYPQSNMADAKSELAIVSRMGHENSTLQGISTILYSAYTRSKSQLLQALLPQCQMTPEIQMAAVKPEVLIVRVTRQTQEKFKMLHPGFRGQQFQCKQRHDSACCPTPENHMTAVKPEVVIAVTTGLIEENFQRQT